MFFFESFSLPAIAMFCLVLVGLIAVNELSRRNLCGHWRCLSGYRLP